MSQGNFECTYQKYFLEAKNNVQLAVDPRDQLFPHIPKRQLPIILIRNDS